jgi:hypothetical protein
MKQVTAQPNLIKLLRSFKLFASSVGYFDYLPGLPEKPEYKMLLLQAIYGSFY